MQILKKGFLFSQDPAGFELRTFLAVYRQYPQYLMEKIVDITRKGVILFIGFTHRPILYWYCPYTSTSGKIWGYIVGAKMDTGKNHEIYG